MISRRQFCAAAVGVAASGRAFAQTPPDWDAVIAAAKKEGVVTLYSGLVGTAAKAVGAAFQAKYGIRVDVLEVRASELRERVRTESVANRVLVDTMWTSAVQTRQFAVDDKTIQPFGAVPNLGNVSPELRELWTNPDMHVPVFTLRYGILVNTSIVKSAPKKYADLLDPFYKGKILADDFRAEGGGNTFFTVTYEKLGEEFLRKLSANDVTFTRDQRGAERRVARGEYAVYLPFLLNNWPPLQGLPVQPIILEEGVTYTPFSGSLVRGAPHPNAGRLFIDFMISKEGQSIIASNGLWPILDGLADQFPPLLRPYANTKLLGARDGTKTEFMFKAAKEIFK
jgi:iron(III) transport system substrate-binding protein